MKDMTAVLVGATGGIGSAIAEKLRGEGASLVLAGRSGTRLNTLKKRLNALPAGGAIQTCICDISQADHRRNLVSFIERLPKSVDVVINNAGINDFALFEHQSDETITGLLQVNALYPLLLTRLFLTYFTQRGISAQIINVGSTFGSIAHPGFAAYCASKFALRGGTQALAREYADTLVRIRYFAPRATLTALNSDRVVSMNTELGVKMDPPERVAGEFFRFLNNHKSVYHLGWPERCFVFMNNILPGVVSGALKKSLPVIRRHAEPVQRGDSFGATAVRHR